MKRKFYSVLALLSLSAGALFGQTSTFNFTGSMQTFTVPCGVDTVFIQTWGAEGGAGATGGIGASGGAGGLGGYAEGWLLVTPGQTLNIFVGGQGATPSAGFNGGADGGNQNSGGGGGSSDVRATGIAESDRVITAGGGGGGGRAGCESTNTINGGSGGAGGGGNGANGIDAPTSGGDAGGGQGGFSSGAGGAAGIGCGGFLGQPGFAGTGGAGGIGGAGQSCCCFGSGSIPGGGGGGFIGGGGGGGGSAGTTGCSGNDKGAGGGGGSGTSDVSGVLNGVTNNGIWLGNGQVTISWNVPVPGVLPISGAVSICEFTSTTLTCATSGYATDYTWAVQSGLTLNSGQGTNSINVSGTPGIYTVTVVGNNTPCLLTGPVSTFTLTVNANPVVTVSSTSPICMGDSDTLTASGANLYAWSSGGTSATEIVSPTGNTTYTVVGTDGNFCMDTTTVAVVVNPLPVLTVSNDTTICNGGSATLMVSGATSYLWLSSGGTGSTEVVSPTDTTTYTVIGTDINGCSSVEDIEVTVAQLPILTTSNDTTVCAGSLVVMSVSGAATYSWSSGGTGSIETVSPTTATTYTVTGTSAQGCTSMATITVSTNALPSVTYSIPAGTHCVADGNFVLTGGSPAGGTYSGTAVTAGIFNPATAGVGTHVIIYAYTDSSGCSASSMDTMTVSSCVGINESNNVYGVTVMPNPAVENLHVQWDANAATVRTLEVYDNAGRLVMTSVVNGGNTADINVSALPVGNYTLSVITSDSKGTYQFIKQ